MNPVRYLSRVATVLAGALLALAAAVPPALALERPPMPSSGWRKHPPWPPAHLPGPGSVHTVVVGGMPGWQITLIAVGAALAAATVAVFADRTWRHRYHAVPGQLSGAPAQHASASR